MKNFISFLIAGFICTTAIAQTDEEKTSAEAIDILVGGTFAKPKILPKLTKLAVAQVSIDFKQATTKSATKTEKKSTLIGKSNVASATASVTAYLETTDGELTDADYREITDEFYYYLQSKLKEGGIDTVAWSAVTATDFYIKDGKEKKEEDNEEEKKNGQTWVTYNALNANTLYGGGIVFAFGKMKRASKFCDDLDAPAVFVNATVDFADILVDVDVKTTGYRSAWTPSYNTVGPVTKMKSKTSVAAFMKVAANGGNTLLWNEKMQSETLGVVQDIPAATDFSDGLSEDPSLIDKRKKLFSISFSKKLVSTPVVISTTRAKYKAAAKKALERYADAIVAKAKVVRK